MKLTKKKWIVIVMFFHSLLSLNLSAQVYFTAKEELTVFIKASEKSDSLYIISINERVEVLEVKKVWSKKWAKIQHPSKGQGYVIFHDLKSVDSKQEIQESNTFSEETSTQKSTVKVEYSEPQNQNLQDFDKKLVNNSIGNTKKNKVSSNRKDNYGSQINEYTNWSFPNWGWYAIISAIVISIVLYFYNNYLLHKFTYDLFSKQTLLFFPLSFYAILYLFYLIKQNDSDRMWGITNNTFITILIITTILIIGIIYFNNLKRTNWYLAIINIIIQFVVVALYFFILIGWLIIKSIRNYNSSFDTQSSSSFKNKGVIKPYHYDLNKEWEWDGKQLKPYHYDLNKVWEFDGKQLTPYHYDLNKVWEWDGKQLKPYHYDLNKVWEWDGKQITPYHYDLNKVWEFNGKQLKPYHYDLNKEWVIEGDIPIPVILKAAGII